MGACMCRQKSTAEDLKGKTVEEAGQERPQVAVPAAGAQIAPVAPVKVFRDGQV